MRPSFRAVVLCSLLAGCGARSSLVDSQRPAEGGAGGTGAGGTGGTGGTGTGAGGTGGDEPTACTPMEVVSCYDGPPGTAGVGQCVSGTATCLPDGSGFGPCTGQVLPAREDCQSAADEDCDGQPGTCQSPWAIFPGMQAYPTGMAVDPAGGVVVAAAFLGEVQIGGLSLDAAGASDFFVARMSPTGEALWARQIHNTGEAAIVIGSVVLRGDDIVVTGSAGGDLTVGPFALPGAGGFILSFDADGDVLWAIRTFDFGNRAAVTASGDIVVVGWRACDFAPGIGCGPEPSVTRLDASGNTIWKTTLDVESYWFRPFGLGVTPGDEVYLGGILFGTVELGGLPLSLPNGGMFLARMDAGGTVEWAQSFIDAGVGGLQLAYPYFVGNGPTVGGYEGTARVSSFNLGVAPNGDAIVTGLMTQSVAFGDPPLSSGSQDLFFARFDAGGDHVWSRTAGGPVFYSPPAMSVTPGGEIVSAAFSAPIPGAPQGSIDFGGGPLAPGVAVARLAQDGAHLASTVLPADALGSAWLTTGAAGGQVCVTGNVTSPITISGKSGTGMFVGCFPL